ncbi:MAG: NADH-quinone oxidoreductase subunit D [Candidatus Electrothrix aestuarii]|uniref:NADH-quinone oxidoreductase subunit D n=1 Tax=Candidatus Electrothrix aestuarii TaxID=3062594 RepID=A0AAU8LSG4_9BACT|nr:NADH-quinone oxidoreductase subunit D [Candidatus Electrothrix aestuarii]WPD21504.1 MAG: NADH-quinone oxidoreductase subunit D [Candidatus Electrothrix sp. GW3-3]
MTTQSAEKYRLDGDTLPEGFRLPVSDNEDADEFFVNIGPQHPSTHGVLRIVVRLSGETVVEAVPHLGYIHRGIEKMAENQTYIQNIHLTDRLDYLSAFFNNLCFCMAVEQAMEIGVPERGEYIRVMICELQRLQSHLLWWGVMGMDLGAFTPFLYGFREREMITDIFEEMSGGRLTVNFFRPGGSAFDATENFIPRIKKFIKAMYKSLDEYNTLLSGNVIFLERTRGVGILTREEVLAYGCSGAVLRGSDVCYDVRKNDPYSIYDQFDFDIPTKTEGDSLARYQIKMEEMAQSLRILEQAVKKFPEGPYRSQPKAIYKLPKGSYYSQVETPRGILGTYIVSDGGTKPYRVKYRSPNFSNLSALNHAAQGLKLADLVTIMSSMDFVIPDMDK